MGNITTIEGKSVLFLITSYNREKECRRIIDSVNDQCKRNKIKVSFLIINDGSKESYKSIREKENVYYLENEENLGKKGYWKTVSKLFSKVKKLNDYDYYFMVPDDVILDYNFVEESIKKWESIEDKNKITLSLYLRRHRVGLPNWTKVKPKFRKYNNYTFYYTQWVDMMFICEKSFFEFLNYKINKIHESRWRKNNFKSSGVGEQITRRLFEAGYSMYQVARNNFVSDKEALLDSKMNSELRKQSNIYMYDRIVASMATIPSREEIMRKVVDRITPQVDLLRIYLNNFNYVPDFLKDDSKIEVYRSQEEIGDITDAGKFYKVEDIKGYHILVDDDIDYPPDFVHTIISKLKNRKNKCIVTFHGKNFLKDSVKTLHPRTRFEKSFMTTVHRKSKVKKTQKVDIGGTGVMGYHTDDIKFSIYYFLTGCMADIWCAIKCMKENVPIFVLKHSDKFLKVFLEVERMETIYEKLKYNKREVSDFQTEIVNKFLLSGKKVSFSKIKESIPEKYLLDYFKSNDYEADN